MRKLLISLLLAIFLLGCTQTEQLTTDQIVEKMNEKYNKTHDIKGKIVVTQCLGNETISPQTIKFLIKKPDRFKEEIESSMPLPNGTTRV
jgi:outer membrane lipoprotein-sorting protein